MLYHRRKEMKTKLLRVAVLFIVAFQCSSMSVAQACPTPAQLQSDLNGASQAAIISLSGVNPPNCPQIPMTQTWTGGKLIFSDSPESPATRGKLYEDAALAATSGTAYNRIFLYHANGNTSSKMKFSVLVKNLGASAATLTVQKQGTAGPTTNYPYGGKIAFYRWLNAAPGTGISVASGATVRLDQTFDVTQAATAYLMHGIWDYSFTQPHQVTICALDGNDDPLSVCPGLPVLSRDTHVRGTFPSADKIYDAASGFVINTANGIQQFSIAQLTSTDSYATGIDATDGSAVTDGANYGILYRIHLSTASSDGRNLSFLFNPRAGTWSGAVMTMP
jgi:hypothetical protein